MQNEDMTLNASIMAVFLCIIFGCNTVAIKFSLTGFGAFTLPAIRFAIASFVLFMWARYKKIPLKIKRDQIGRIAILSSVFTMQLCLLYAGIDKTTASHSVLISNIVPFIVLILAHFFIPGDTLTIKKGMGITLGFIGVLFLLFDTQGLDSDIKNGDFLVLLGVFCWSCNIIFLKRMIHEFNAIQVTIYPMLLGTPCFLIAGLIWDVQMLKDLNGPVISAMLYQAIISASFGFLVWNNMMQRFGATALHSFMFIMPMAGVLAGVLILGDAITPNLAISIILIVAGVVVVNLKRRQPATIMVEDK
jgi:drug/metabolite transporter (DMT)-like permease